MAAADLRTGPRCSGADVLDLGEQAAVPLQAGHPMEGVSGASLASQDLPPECRPRAADGP